MLAETLPVPSGKEWPLPQNEPSGNNHSIPETNAIFQTQCTGSLLIKCATCSRRCTVIEVTFEQSCLDSANCFHQDFFQWVAWTHQSIRQNFHRHQSKMCFSMKISIVFGCLIVSAKDGLHLSRSATTCSCQLKSIAADYPQISF